MKTTSKQFIKVVQHQQADAKRLYDLFQQQQDTLEDTTQLMQLRLQKYLDAVSKEFEILSNILKRHSEVVSELIKNIK